MGAIMLCGGEKGKRHCFTTFQSNDSSAHRGLSGPSIGYRNSHSEKSLSTREKLNKILSDHSGQSMDQIKQDTDSDNFMSAEEAQEYGLIDSILQKRA